MNPVIMPNGRSFKGAHLYYMHDRNHATTRERIAWTQTQNMMTEDPDKAWTVMAYTAKNQSRLKEASGTPATGRKLEKPVLTYALSWHPDDRPEPDHMQDTALSSLQALGLEEHEALIVAHSDTPHRHTHIIVNRVHPITGKAASDSHTKRKLSEFAYTYQKEHGMTHSPQREKNRKKREEGQPSRYYNPDISEAWDNSDNGQSFATALQAEGYTLANGRRDRLIIVDPYGKTLNPVRYLKDIKIAEFRERTADIDRAHLPCATEAAKSAAEAHEARKAETVDRQKEKSEQSSKQPSQRHKAAPDERSATTASEKKSQKQNSDESGQLTPYEADKRRLARRHQELERQTKQEVISRLGLKETKTEIRSLQDRTQNASWWKKLLGFTRSDQNRLKETQARFEEDKVRYREQMQAIQATMDTEKRQLEERHRQTADRTARSETAEARTISNAARRDELVARIRAKQRAAHQQRNLGSSHTMG